MSAPKTAAGLAALTDAYDVLLSDVWGVIHNGRENFPEACAALAAWRREKGPVILISNSPRPRAQVIEQLASLGVDHDVYSQVVTSGDATRGILARHAPGPAWKIGPDRDGPLYEGLGIEFSRLEEASFIACTGPDDDEVESPADYRERLAKAAARELVMVCANPDKVVQRGDKLIYCGGALADLYQTLGGTVEMAGKPFGPIYDLAIAAAGAVLGHAAERARVLCVGDGVVTDVRGANAQGLDVLFVARGIHGDELMAGPGQLNLKAVETRLAEDGAAAQWVIPDVVW